MARPDFFYKLIIYDNTRYSNILSFLYTWNEKAILLTKDV